MMVSGRGVMCKWWLNIVRVVVESWVNRGGKLSDWWRKNIRLVAENYLKKYRMCL